MRTGHSDFQGEDICLRLIYLAGYVIEVKILRGVLPTSTRSLLGASVESPESFRRVKRKCRNLVKGT